MTPTHHAPYTLGHTRATTLRTEGSPPVTVRDSLKADLCSYDRLQPACLKSEWLIIAGQNTAVNAFRDVVHTARLGTKADNTRSR